MTLKINFDGAYRFHYNKHEYGCGWVLSDDDGILVESCFGGVDEEGSSNKAEYLALESALSYLKFHEISFDRLVVEGDSKLVINQLKGEWKINEGKYKEVAIRLKKSLDTEYYNNIKFRWTRRENNSHADELSKRGLNGREYIQTQRQVS